MEGDPSMTIRQSELRPKSTDWFRIQGAVVSSVHFGSFGTANNWRNVRIFFEGGGYVDLLDHDQEGLQYLTRDQSPVAECPEEK